MAELQEAALERGSKLEEEVETEESATFTLELASARLAEAEIGS